MTFVRILFFPKLGGRRRNWRYDENKPFLVGQSEFAVDKWKVNLKLAFELAVFQDAFLK